ncbi:MAG TPA: hypothetical protein VE994_08425, partial [Terriglobales bacterium]|nr:hypothetical protein [Terriglobales bacterium]
MLNAPSTRFRFFTLCFIALAALISSHAQERPAADLIITNAKIYTVDKNLPKAEAVAILGDRIVG